MPGPKLDGAGNAKMETLEAALATLQRLHGVVEQCGVAVKQKKPLAPLMPQIRRYSTPLVGLLKGQFGTIADLVAAFVLQSTRGGGSDQMRLRMLREAVAQIRVQLELAVAKTFELHTTNE
jgi:hypothetical protein